MEKMGSVSSLLWASTALLLSWGLFRIIYAVWWKPMRIKQFMKKQGVDGPPAELIFGNARETMRTFFQAWAKPMSLCHDIVPRVLPFFDDVVKKYETAVLCAATWRRRLKSKVRGHTRVPTVVSEPRFHGSKVEPEASLPANKHRRKKPTSLNKKKLNDDVTNILKGMVQRRIKEMKMGSPKKGDMLEMLLESCNYNNVHEEQGSLKEMGMSIDDVIEECKLFYFAGQGTTGVTLTWTMIVLSMHPEWQSRAREEVLQVCGKEAPTFDQLSQLKIVTMVLYEVLRLYSPVVMLSRHASKRMQLGHLDIPEGVQLLLPLLFMQHDPALWGDDSNEFNPDRFSEGVVNAAKHQMAFYPFGCGPRICLGYTFAMMEAKVAVAMILQHFSFELSPSYIHAPCPVMTLQPQHGAPLIVHKL